MRGFRKSSSHFVDPEEYRSSRPTVNYSLPPYYTTYSRQYDPPVQPQYPQEPPPYTANEHQPWDASFSTFKADSGTEPPSPEPETERPPPQGHGPAPLGPRPSREREPTDYKPFVLLGCVLDAFDLADNLLKCAIYVHGPGSPETRPVRDFIDELIEFGKTLRGLEDIKDLCEEREISRKVPEAKDIVNKYSRAAKDLKASIQDFISLSEEAMPRFRHHSDGSLKYAACLWFIGTMLGKKLGLTEYLTSALRRWCYQYDESCVPLLKKMQETARRIEDDKLRREEEASEREERWRREEELRREDTWRQDDRMLEERPHRREKHRHGKHRN